MSQGGPYKRVSGGKAKLLQKVLRTEESTVTWLAVPRMDPAAPAVAPPGLAPAQAPVQAQIGGREVSGSER